MSRRGLLIVFEGLDKSGKSTQAKLLTDALNARSMPTEICRNPNRTTNIGQMINDYLCKKIELEDHAVHLLFSANRWETVKQLKEKLNSGINLVVDRYAYSGVAYTAAKTGFDFEWCKQCDKGLPKPDFVCFMDTKLAEVDSRENFGEERYESAEFQKLVYQNFKLLFNLDNKAEINNVHNCVLFNAKDTIENLHDAILKYILDLIKTNKFTINEFKHLW